ncbi:MAG: hypothetical protein AB1696_20685 [Planctomycetota bacterium]
MRRIKSLCLLGCFCLPFLLAAGCEEEPKQHTVYREKVVEDKPVKDEKGEPVKVFIVE